MRFIRLVFKRLRILLFIMKRSSFKIVTFSPCPIAIIMFLLSLKTISFMEYESKSCVMPLSAVDGLKVRKIL